MALIKNLVKDREENKIKDDGDEEDDKLKKPRPTIKTTTDLQRLKLEKLMKNPDKIVEIPEHKQPGDFMKSVPTFVRNVMGSSAGAGSGEFHVYRHLRRKEFARQKLIGSISQREKLDEEYQNKLEENQRKAEERTAKKRAKRLKKKCKKARRQHDGTRQQAQSRPAEEETDTSEDEEEETEARYENTQEQKGKSEEPENKVVAEEVKESNEETAKFESEVTEKTEKMLVENESTD